MSAERDGVRRAWGWLAHLRSGGTSSWADWRARPDGDAEATDRALPGAQQLEVLRRLNLLGPTDAVLADRVLGVSSAGRGSPDLELVGVVPESPFGPRPVDPARLPAGELLRVVTSLLAEELTALETASPPPSTGEGRTWWWRRGDRVVGAPLVAAELSAQLARRGRAPGRRAAVWVMGAPLAQLLAESWADRCFRVGAPRWAAWLSGLEQRRQLPPRIDLPRVAEHWAGQGRVTVLLDPELAAARLGLPAPAAGVSADAAELARRLAPVLGLLVSPDRRARLLSEVLRPRLTDPAGALPGVPPDRAEWVARRARLMADRLSAGDYAVVGDPRTVLPSPGDGPPPSGPGALGLGLRVLREGLTTGRGAGPEARPKEAGG